MLKKDYQLTSEELAMEKELDHYVSVPNLEIEKARYAKIAKATLAKKSQKKVITIRLPEEVIGKFKLMAEEEGIPYQTLISSVLYKVANKKLSLVVE